MAFIVGKSHEFRSLKRLLIEIFVHKISSDDFAFLAVYVFGTSKKSMRLPGDDCPCSWLIGAF